MLNVLKDGIKFGDITHRVFIQRTKKIIGTLIKQNVNKSMSGHGTDFLSVYN